MRKSGNSNYFPFNIFFNGLGLMQNFLISHFALLFKVFENTFTFKPVVYKLLF